MAELNKLTINNDENEEETKYLVTLTIGILEGGNIDISAFWVNHTLVADMFGQLMWGLTNGEMNEALIQSFVAQANDDEENMSFILEFLRSWKKLSDDIDEPMIDPIAALNITNMRGKKDA